MLCSTPHCISAQPDGRTATSSPVKQSLSIYVLGAVHAPGVVDLPPRKRRLLDAIDAAGGVRRPSVSPSPSKGVTTGGAARMSARLLRQGGATTISLYDLRRNDVTRNMTLRAGDIVMVTTETAPLDPPKSRPKTKPATNSVARPTPVATPQPSATMSAKPAVTPVPPTPVPPLVPAKPIPAPSPTPRAEKTVDGARPVFVPRVRPLPARNTQPRRNSAVLSRPQNSTQPIATAAVTTQNSTSPNQKPSAPTKAGKAEPPILHIKPMPLALLRSRVRPKNRTRVAAPPRTIEVRPVSLVARGRVAIGAPLLPKPFAVLRSTMPEPRQQVILVQSPAVRAGAQSPVVAKRPGSPRAVTRPTVDAASPSPVGFSQPYVRASGAVRLTGPFRWHDGLTARQLLESAGYTERALLRRALLQRGAKQIPFDGSATAGDQHSGPLVHAGDVLHIPSGERELRVEGAVKRPGRHDFRAAVRAFDAAVWSGGAADK
ncbi:MAG TPA: SLBB domain-containing protein, partial [Abditibacteriaceae bacterium]